MNSIQTILSNLNYKGLTSQKKAGVDLYVHKFSNMPIVYFSVAQPQEKLKKVLIDIWNENNARLYVTMDTEKDREEPAIELYNPRIRPALDNEPIDSFNYDEDKDRYKKILVNLRKERVDAGILWEFIRDRLLKRKEKTVDKDLIKNLTALKGNLQKEKEIDENIAHILIDRCIFLKFMEDRKFIDGAFLAEFNCGNFVSLLSQNDFGLLNKVFVKANELFNGDIFKEKIDGSNAGEETIQELHRFFTSDYTTGQLEMFPYKFDIISLSLISNIYESFLKEERREKGIYYTPESVVDLILDETLEEKIKQKLEKNENPNISIFDPACGSGIFLVKALKRLIKGYETYLGNKPTIEKGSEILQKNIYGVDLDEKAIRIAIFSLYLSLLEGEDPQKIKNKIRQGFKFPGLKDKNLLVKNSFGEGIFEEKRFDCIVGNPPWGYKFKEEDEKLLGCLKAKFPDCSDKQSSQLFLRKAKDWSKEDTKFGFVVNSSNFYNLRTNKFRVKFMESYKLTKYIELSKIKDIIFETSNQPGAILMFDNKVKKDNKIKYYVPRHNNLSKYLGVILLGDKDEKVVRRKQLLENDDLWKVLVNGNLEDYRIIKKLRVQKFDNYEIACSVGFGPQIKEEKSNGEPRYRKMITKKQLKRYFMNIDEAEDFNWNEDLIRRKGNEEMFRGERLIVLRAMDKRFEPLVTAFANAPFIFRDDIMGVRIDGVNDFYILQAILNSKLLGYYFYLISPQWGKGTRNVLRAKDVEKFPLIQIDDRNSKFMELRQLSKKITQLQMEQSKQPFANSNIEQWIKEIEDQIDELVFDIYNLNEPEKQRIRDFCLVNAGRKEESKAKHLDMEKYLTRFKEIFEKLLKEKVYLNTEYYISNLLGAAVCFKIEDTEKSMKRHSNGNKTILQLLTNVLTNKRIKEYDSTHILGQRKIKIYDKDVFYIIKSNEFRDWTLTEAIEDVREEIASYFNVNKENGR